MSFFRNYPFTAYRFGNEIDPAVFQNLTTYIDIVDQVKDDLSFYEQYYIRDNMRPDVLSYELYGSIDHYWTFFLINDKLRLQGWPLTEKEVYSLARRYYPNKTLITNRALHGKFYKGDICARQKDPAAAAPFKDPPFKARILHNNYDMGQIVVKPIVEVRSIIISDAGTGYTQIPTVTITGGSGYGATAYAEISGGSLTGIKMITGGEDYDTAPKVTISLPNDSSGTQARANAYLSLNELPTDTDLYSQKGEPNTDLWDNDQVSILRVQTSVRQDIAPHHYEDGAGNYVDLPILTDVGKGVDNESTGTGGKNVVRNIDRLLNENNALRNIKVLSRSAVGQVTSEFQRLLRQ